MKNTPLLDIAHTVVLGGTFTGMDAALQKARAGEKVILVESRTYLGYEITATLRPWIPVDGEPYPELIAACIDATGLPASRGEYPLRLDTVKRHLEDILMDAGVVLLYACNPIVRLEDGLIVGSKAGFGKITCSQVLDARFFPSMDLVDTDSIVSISLEFEGLGFAEYQGVSDIPDEIVVPQNLGMQHDRVRLHRGYNKGRNYYLHSHFLVECLMALPQPGWDPFSFTRRYLDARARAIAVASYLLWEHPAFRLASLGKVSEALYEPAMDQLSPRPLEEGALQELDLGQPFHDVLVVGGGTSGAHAAIAAAQQGVRTLVVEMNPGLGGTGTYGGVSAYWMGRQVGFSARSVQWTNQLHDRLRFPHMNGLNAIWNIEAKTQALIEQAQAIGVDFLIDTRVVDALVEDGRLTGVLAATPFGPVRLNARVLIDATGDADLAAFAGANFEYGSQRDGSVMWYSLPQFKGSGKIQSNFTAMLDLTNPVDYSRAVVWGRRRGGELYDHGGYLAPRETRRIQGEVTQTLSDQLRRRAYPDVISLAASNNDMKGLTSSDWMKVGLIPPNLQIELSYGMLIPKGLDGLLVVGKAVSAERDALPSIRMQPDLENLGGAAGIAAALAAKSGRALRDIDLAELQRQLVEIGVLPPEIRSRNLKVQKYTQEEIAVFLGEIIRNPQPLRNYSHMEVDEVYQGRIPFVELCCAGEQAVPQIQQALQRPLNHTTRRQLGIALALMGNPSAVDVLFEEIRKELAGEKLPGLSSSVRHARPEAPDQAAMPEAAYLLNALALLADRRAIPLWEQVVDKLVDATMEEVFSIQSGFFAYVDAVCSGAERLADSAVRPMLDKLANAPAFKGHQLKSLAYPTGPFSDYLLERAAYLELVIARARARCGSPHGILTLTSYLSDVRSLYARHAHQELVAISGQDFGMDAAAWGQWLETASEGLKPVPWDAQLEAVVAIQTEIFVSESS